MQNSNMYGAAIDREVTREMTTALELARLGVRWARGPRRLERTVGMHHSEIRKAFRDFRHAGVFPGGFVSLRNSDQYKAVVLYALCRFLKPRVVVETGVASGTSALGILRALEGNGRGHLHSVDLPNVSYQREDGRLWNDSLHGKEPGWLVPGELRGRWSLHLGPSRQLLPVIVKRVGQVDLFYHDSEHTDRNVRFELECIWGAIAPGGIIVADNVNWNNAFFPFCASRGLPSCVLFPHLGVSTKPRTNRVAVA